MGSVGPNIFDYLLAGKEEGREALNTLQQTYTYGQLRSAATDIASHLISSGGKKGDRVLLIADNSFFWVATYLGVLLAGLVCVPLPPIIDPEDLELILTTTGAGICFLQTALVRKYIDRLRGVRIVTDGVAPRPEALNLAQLATQPRIAQTELPTVNASDLAALMFTSGSTGQPRGVMVSHANIRANTESIIEYLELTSNDRIMTVLPFHYCFGTSLLHTHLRVGGSLVIDPRFMYPEKVLQRMQETECTGFAGVPSHYQVLVRKTGLRKKSFPHLRYVQQAGGHLAVPFLRELHEALPQTKIFVMYGQTEATARLSYLPPHLLSTKMGSIGRGIPGVKLAVLNDKGIAVQPGEVGEIVAEGPNIASGYWQAPEETALSFRNGKLHTGDLAIVDNEGFISIVGRSRDFLKCGGKRISCHHIEQQLLEWGELLEAAVIGIPDEMMGEAVKAFVVPRPGLTLVEDHLLEFCRKRLSFELVPREIVVMEALPKNQSGKVLKEKLRALAPSVLVSLQDSENPLT